MHEGVPCALSLFLSHTHARQGHGGVEQVGREEAGEGGREGGGSGVGCAGVGATSGSLLHSLVTHARMRGSAQGGHGALSGQGCMVFYFARRGCERAARPHGREGRAKSRVPGSLPLAAHSFFSAAGAKESGALLSHAHSDRARDSHARAYTPHTSPDAPAGARLSLRGGEPSPFFASRASAGAKGRAHRASKPFTPDPTPPCSTMWTTRSWTRRPRSAR